MDFSVNSVNTTHFRLNCLRYFMSKACNMVPPELKDLNDVGINLKLENGNQSNANENYVCHICTV